MVIMSTTQSNLSVFRSLLRPFPWNLKHLRLLRMNHHVDDLLHLTGIILFHWFCTLAWNLLDRLFCLSRLQVVVVLLLLLQSFLYELRGLVEQNRLLLLHLSCFLAGLGRSVEFLQDLILAVLDVAVPFQQVSRMQVSEYHLKLLVYDACDHDYLLGVDEVLDGWDLCSEQAWSKHYADVVFAHLVVLRVEDHLPDEAKEQEDRHLVDFGQVLDGLDHDLHEVRLIVAGHQHLEELVRDYGHSEVREESLQGVLIWIRAYLRLHVGSKRFLGSCSFYFRVRGESKSSRQWTRSSGRFPPFSGSLPCFWNSK